MKTKKIIALALFLFSVCAIYATDTKTVTLEKELTYDQHTLTDTYPYSKATREFQWDKIKEKLVKVDSLREKNSDRWAILQNKSNRNGKPANAKEFTTNEYHGIVDRFGVPAYQSIPLFLACDLIVPERYALDGSLVNIVGEEGDFVIAFTTFCDEEYLIPKKFVHQITGTPDFAKVIVVDRTNQNISTFEKVGDTWKVRSMNPATTGLHKPPYQKETPLGLFVLQQKVAKMEFYADGTTNIAGFAPYASRFSAGGYIHGVPINYPRTEMIEFSSTLGTTPRSHMCVRNATSHAKFVFDNFPVDDTLVFVIE